MCGPIYAENKEDDLIENPGVNVVDLKVPSPSQVCTPRTTDIPPAAVG